MGNLELKQLAYAETFPWVGWDRDLTITTLSAVFSIALIPVGIIYFLANRVARWVVTFFTLVELARLPSMIAAFQATGGAVHWSYFAQPALLALALIFLFVPASSRWFSHRKGIDPETFA